MSLTISIDRTSLSLSALVLSGTDDANAIGVTDYTEPSTQPRITYAPDSAYIPGSQPLAATWQQTILGFNVVTDQATSEATSRTKLAELRAALAQFSYTVAVVVDGAPSETWTCLPATITPLGARTYMDLIGHDPVWSVTIPCYPIRTIGA